MCHEEMVLLNGPGVLGTRDGERGGSVAVCAVWRCCSAQGTRTPVVPNHKHITHLTDDMGSVNGIMNRAGTVSQDHHKHPFTQLSYTHPHYKITNNRPFIHKNTLLTALTPQHLCSTQASPAPAPHLADLHGGWEGLGVRAQNVAKVDVEQAAVGAQHEVVQVAVTHTCGHEAVEHIVCAVPMHWCRG